MALDKMWSTPHWKLYTSRCPSAWAQLEPNTLIEAEGLSANAKARAEALRLTRSSLTEEEYSGSDRTGDDTVSGENSEMTGREGDENGKSFTYV
ncbi:10773_t:CDS:2 [Paraglomus brasilianum]|uniref:10773_t:CDS:1 n=1 Tax=Paraglomus brasilianum TaxID=144538 RepID=A0A9N9C3X8_9GLOM|nr:10773_t:CDS:2 [Paraglomus brasilianum]